MADNSVYSLRSLGYSEILKRNMQLAKTADGKLFEVDILSNITVNPIKEVLEYYLRTLSLKPVIRFGNYDNIVQDSFTLPRTDLVIVFYELLNLADNFVITAELLTDEEVHELIAKCKQNIDLIFSNLSQKPLVLFNKFSSLAFSIPVYSKRNIAFIEEELNNYIVSKKPANTCLIDLHKLVGAIGIENAIDTKKFAKYKSLYKLDFLKLYVSSVENLLLRRVGKLKKALVFDCDNTLWKGVIGEDGPEGIDMSAKSEIGKNFYLVQQIAAALSQKGVLICLCSKNNLAEVEGLFGKHVDMIINNDHIVTHRINWNNKDENLKEIATELNIGLDTLVFIDDSDFEINLVRERVPEVLAFAVPFNLNEYPGMVMEIAQRYFNLEPLQEDLKKVQQYKEQAKRAEEMNQVADIDSYLATLGTKIIVRKNNREEIARIAQLTQKTNQFNLTTKRYTETEIEAFINNTGSCVFSIDVSDKFGSSGITGVIILQETGEGTIDVDSFLMSCRIIGRKIETKFLDYVIRFCKSENYKQFTATYSRTKKNSQVKDFYQNHQFEVVHSSEEQNDYKLDLAKYNDIEIGFIQLIEE